MRARPPRVNVPYLIRDRHYLRRALHDKGPPELLLATPLQTHSALDDGGFEDGPVHPRVAIVDLDPATAIARPPARFRLQGIGRTVSCYDLGKHKLGPESPPEAFESDAFLQVSPFATVLKTLEFFEGPQILGRRVPWAFGREQIRVFPRAGNGKNAYYVRDLGALKFFHYGSAAGHTVYTALSHDIVVHETTHAILDGIAPDLYDATTPESLALHEAIADLSAVTQTLLNRMVVFSLFAISGGSIDPFEALSRLAEEFGSDARVAGGGNFLRRMKNHFTLDPADESRDEFGRPNRPQRTDFHATSQVLSGALYSVFERRMQVTRRGSDNPHVPPEDIFCPAANRVARIMFRALDYLPPGEASFADFGRAFLAAASATYARPQKEQEWLREEFLRRRIVDSEAELNAGTPLWGADLGNVDFDAIMNDDASARRFAEEQRDLLRIPAGRPFEVLPRVVAARSFGSRSAKDRKDELILKIRWNDLEVHDLGALHASTWRISKGTTLVLDLRSRRILSCLTTDGSERQRTARDAMRRHWAATGQLRAEHDAAMTDSKRPANAVLVRFADGAARAVGAGNTLHLNTNYLQRVRTRDQP